MYRLILLAVVIAALVQLFSRYRSGLISGRRSMFWGLLWTVALVLGMVPQWSDWFTNYLGVGRGADLFFFFGILLLGYLLLILYAHTRRLESQITDLVRELALREEPPQESGEAP